MEVLKLLVFAWLTATALWALKALWAGSRKTSLFCIVCHWIFNGIPQALDLIVGIPNYHFVNMAKATENPTTNVIYLFYIAAIPIALHLIGTSWTRAVSIRANAETEITRPPNLMLYLLLVLPPLTILFAPEPSLYLHYAFVADDRIDLTPEMITHQTLVTLASILSIVAATSLLHHRLSLIRTLLLTLPWVGVAVYLNGKRFIAAFYLVLLTMRLWDMGLLKGMRLFIYSSLIGTLFLTFSFAYQAFVRGINSAPTSQARLYENFRLDYGRDHTIKDAIYAELHDQKILGYRGQSVIFNLTAFVPRNWWPEKPYPYAVYHTCWALDTKPQLLGWGFTTSIFDEAIANFSWFGMLLGPVFMGLLCRLADSNNNVVLRSLGYIVCMLFMVVHLSAFMSLFVFWLIGTLWQPFRGFLSLKPRMNNSPQGSP